MGITHAFVSAKSDGSDPTELQPSNWNADHVGGAVLLTGHGSPVGTNAVKEIIGGPSLSGGTWTITYLAATTAPIAWNAHQADIQAALETLGSVSDPEASFSTNNGSLDPNWGIPVDITFQFQLGSQPIPGTDFTINPSGLTGDTATVTDNTVGVVPLAASNGDNYLDLDTGNLYLMVAGNWWQTYPILQPFGVNGTNDGFGLSLLGGAGAGGGSISIRGGAGVYDGTLGEVSIAAGSMSGPNLTGSHVTISGGAGGSGTGAPAQIIAYGGQPNGVDGTFLLNGSASVIGIRQSFSGSLSSGFYDEWSIQTYGGNTTDATPTVLLDNKNNSLILPDFAHTCVVRGRVVGRRTDTPGTNSGWDFAGVIRGDGSSAYSWGSTPVPAIIYQDSGAAAWAVALSISGASIVVTVTGEVGKTIDWMTTIELDEVV